MGGADRRGEVLAAGADGAAEPGGEGHLHRLRGWAEGISGSHRSGVSAHRGTALHRAPGAGLAELRALEAAQAGGDGPAVDLPRSHSGRGRAASPGTGRQMESLSQREPGVAAELGAHHAIFSLSAGHPASDLHYQQRESLNRSLRKIIKTRGGFPQQEAAAKLLFLALRQATKKWT